MTDESKPTQAQQEKQSWLRSWLQRGRAQKAGDTIAAQIGESARNVVVGKNVIQIGTLQIPFYLAVIIAVGVGLITLSTAVIAFTFRAMCRQGFTPGPILKGA